MRRKKIAAFLLAIFSLCLLGMFLRPRSNFEVGEIFAEALIYNEIDSAKRNSLPEIWSVLESWPDKHNAVPLNCKAPLDLDLGTWSISGGVTEDEITRSYVMGRECPDKFYYISIDDMTLRKIDNRWKVISLGKYCESTVNSTEVCLEFD
jgi:hypothetical protein